MVPTRSSGHHIAMLLAQPDPGITGGPPSGLLGLITVVGGAAIVLGLGWLLERRYRRPQKSQESRPPSDGAAAPALPHPPARPLVSAEAKPQPQTDPSDEAEKLLAEVTADYQRRKRLMVESKRLQDWIFEFDVTSLAALSHTHSPGLQSGACPACVYESLGLELLRLQELDPGFVDDPWSELWFADEEDADAFMDGLSEEELELKAQGAAWQARLLESLAVHRNFLHERFRRDQIDYLRTPEAHAPMPEHNHEGKRSFDGDQTYVGCPACRYMHYRRPLD